ncbi:MFS general substrate transporter [Auriscalpium vulgare]|uniref:MFS general substrate transporter n=1 Tax=Auriscalpium vulgare TaxID=40419 RepID=A0ACB8RIL1_9AGAM|nr:MFS general substrate transporter [Auriscalpium vulgare]
MSSTVVAPPAAPYVRPNLSKLHKGTLLMLFCLAEFMDAFVASALFPAIPAMERSLNIKTNEIVWVFSAYSATFAAFLLISGRVSDIYSARWSFIVGSALVGLFSLGCGLVHDKVGMFILRAFTGIAAAATVPSALSLIVEWFPEPEEQSQAIALFGGSSAIGNVLGIIIGGIFVQWANWRWIYYFTCMLGVPIGVISIILVPQSAPRTGKQSWRRLDLGGVAMLTTSIVLFIYAVTTGSATGWGAGQVIGTLVVSIVLAVAFFVFEAKIDPDMASLPPHTWNYPNVPILVALGLVPIFWWCSLFFQLMPLFQTVYGWSAIMTSVHFLPTGIFSGAIAGFSGSFPKYINPKWSIFFGLLADIVATIMLPFGSTRARYWSIIFPAFIIGTMGNMVVYTNSNIAIFMNTPPEIAGTVGAMFNAALQIGLGLGLAVITTIQTEIDQKRVDQGKPVGYHGIADGYWFVLAVLVTEAVALLIWYKIEKPKVADAEAPADVKETESQGTVAEEQSEEKKEIAEILTASARYS